MLSAATLLHPYYFHYTVRLLKRSPPPSSALWQGVKAAGAIPILLKGDTQKMQETYRTFSSEPDGDYGIKASVAIVPNTKILKQVMAGHKLRFGHMVRGGGSGSTLTVDVEPSASS